MYSNKLYFMDNMLIYQILTFLIQINHVWSSYLDKFWIANNKTLYYHKEQMDDSDYEGIMSLHLQVNDFGFNYWNGLNLPKTINSLIVLHIWSKSNLVKFWIPNIPKTVLRSPQVAETDGTMGGPQIKNHTFFVLSL